MSALDFNTIKTSANGHWDNIVLALTQSSEIQTAIEKGHRHHTSCPIHGGKHGDAFRIFPDFNQRGAAICNTCGFIPGGVDLIAQTNKWSIYETYSEIARIQNITGSAKPLPVKTHTVRRPEKPVKDLKQAKHLQKLWNSSKNPNSPNQQVIRKYLDQRGLSVIKYIPPVIRMDNSLSYYDYDDKLAKYKFVANYPTMLSLVTNLNGDAVSIHRTYLTKEGKKAPVESQKKMFRAPLEGSVTGSSIKLYTPTEVLAITEGIETAFAIRAATGLPVWAAISSTLLSNIEIPSFVKKVIIWADLDRPSRIDGSRPGTHFAELCAKRLREKGFAVQIMLPPGEIPADQKSIDWLDIWNASGKSGFPTIQTDL